MAPLQAEPQAAAAPVRSEVKALSCDPPVSREPALAGSAAATLGEAGRGRRTAQLPGSLGSSPAGEGWRHQPF